MALPNGHIQPGGSGRRAPAATRHGVSQGTKLERFSTFNTLSGGELNYKELPVQIVSEIPYTRYCTYSIPKGTSSIGWLDASLQVDTTDVTVAVIKSRPKVGIISVCNDKDMATLEATTILVKGNPVPCKRLTAYTNSLANVYVCGLDAAPFPSHTKDTYNALSPYGTVLDIVFKAAGNFSMGSAKVLVDKSVPKIPRTVEVRGRTLHLFSNNIE
ncbi:hypothetical protein H4S04_002391 [Coemansia sp. S16]|nr:hypothetical protein H4S03_002962 [Coemansia sp. S3946]KAJ2050780.1 hypothetical protein H4S04_002391 [Coemansia sp. S16]KAJ2075025.1 hypothetical protein GGH13_000911 [Coemansia sp. S155-1]